MIAASQTPLIERMLPLLRQAVPQCNFTNISETTKLEDDLGFDSIGLLTFAFLLEEEFSIDVASRAEAFREIATVGDIIHFVVESVPT